MLCNSLNQYTSLHVYLQKASGKSLVIKYSEKARGIFPMIGVGRYISLIHLLLKSGFSGFFFCLFGFFWVFFNHERRIFRKDLEKEQTLAAY